MREPNRGAGVQSRVDLGGRVLSWVVGRRIKGNCRQRCDWLSRLINIPMLTFSRSPDAQGDTKALPALSRIVDEDIDGLRIHGRLHDQGRLIAACPAS